jgi:hypothetical protein
MFAMMMDGNRLKKGREEEIKVEIKVECRAWF